MLLLKLDGLNDDGYWAFIFFILNQYLLVKSGQWSVSTVSK